MTEVIENQKDYLKEQAVKMANRSKSFSRLDENTWIGEIKERFNRTLIKFKITISKQFPKVPPRIFVLNAEKFKGWKKTFFNHETNEIKPKLIQKWNESIDLYKITYNLEHLFGTEYYPLTDHQEVFEFENDLKRKITYHDDDINLYINLNEFRLFTHKEPLYLKKCCVCLNKIKIKDEKLTCPVCNAVSHKMHLLEWLRTRSLCPICMTNIQYRDGKLIISNPEENENAIKCTNCERLVEKDSRFCPHCGQKITEE
ncbi:MAG: hypothetical protein EAX96_06545 [Candidatus Lokiarchaeota archaeon]|nr:hypothetical protein [Candidatus Lokiarchaeota archaeon]